MSGLSHNLELQFAALEADPRSDPHRIVDVLNALARELRFIDSARSAAYSQRAYDLACSGPLASAPYARGMAASVLLLSIHHYLLGNYRETLARLFDAQRLAEACGDLALQAEVLLNLAHTYTILGDLPVALEVALQAVAKCQEAGLRQEEADAFNKLGIVHGKAGRHQQSLDALQASVALYRAIGDQSGEAVLLNDIAVTQKALADYENALASAHQSLLLARQIPLDFLAANALCTIGEIYLAQGNSDQALAHFEQSIARSRQLDFKYLEMFGLMSCGQLHVQNDHVEQALPCLLAAAEIAQAIDTKPELYQCYQALAEAYKRQGDFATALAYHEQYHAVYQTVFNAESDRRISYLQIAHDTETAQKEAEIFRLQNVELEQEIARRRQSEAELQRAHDRLLALRHVDIELTSRLEIGHVLAVALRSAIQLSSAEGGGIWLTEEAGVVRLAQRAGLYPEELVGACLPLDGDIYRQVVQHPHHVLTTDSAAESACVATLAETCALIAIPLVSSQGLVGVLTLESTRPDGFASANVHTFNLLGARIAVAVDNARAHTELERLVAELDAFARTVAHDLKSPLTTIMGYSYLLLGDNLTSPSEAERRENAQIIVEMSEKMNTIIDALLLLSKVRSTAEVTMENVNMAPLIRDVRRRLANLIDAYQADMKEPARWPLARGYAPWIEEVWSNYLSNALKYGGRPPVIELGADAQADGMVRFWVRDNGPGLSPEEQAQLFVPFTRLSQAQVEGHGLGLSIVQRIIEKLGGQVGIESTPGAGSIFSFTLPAASRSEKADR
ncbi:MAG: tetratricopeptide repeat protein [Chloroflexi bacterium]|nr:tetratricopeptide repeat protein [Chloroflexota bacterium]